MRVTDWAAPSWGPTGEMSPLTAWRMTGSNKRAVGSLDLLVRCTHILACPRGRVESVVRELLRWLPDFS